MLVGKLPWRQQGQKALLGWPPLPLGRRCSGLTFTSMSIVFLAIVSATPARRDLATHRRSGVWTSTFAIPSITEVRARISGFSDVDKVCGRWKFLVVFD